MHASKHGMPTQTCKSLSLPLPVFLGPKWLVQNWTDSFSHVLQKRHINQYRYHQYILTNWLILGHHWVNDWSHYQKALHWDNISRVWFGKDTVNYRCALADKSSSGSIGTHWTTVTVILFLCTCIHLHSPWMHQCAAFVPCNPFKVHFPFVVKFNAEIWFIQITMIYSGFFFCLEIPFQKVENQWFFSWH